MPALPTIKIGDTPTRGAAALVCTLGMAGGTRIINCHTHVIGVTY